MGLSQEVLDESWETAFPKILKIQLATDERAEKAFSYLKPQFAACPIPLNTLFDLLWWMNFSMKWQAVSLRMPMALKQYDAKVFEPLTHHFFRTKEFQLWSLANPDKRIRDTWDSYKWPLKAYIRDFTGDEDYYEDKEKVPSLNGMLRTGQGKGSLVVDREYEQMFQLFDDSLRYYQG